MHYGVLVILDEDDDGNPYPADMPRKAVEEAVQEALARHEHDHWDWWQIGGRWTGALVEGYEPADDPKNRESCDVCGGTGKRLPPPKTGPGDQDCNGCESTGTRTKWPTGWAEFGGDVVPLKLLSPEKLDGAFFAVVVRGSWIARETYDPTGLTIKSKFRKNPIFRGVFKRICKQFPDALAVAVDCHN